MNNMQINSIELDNLKGQNVTHELGKTTIFVGESGAGKSSVIQGIKFLISGTLQDGETVRKTAEEIYKLSSADRMSVSLNTDVGSYTRGIERKVKKMLDGVEVKFSKNADVSNRCGEKTATELSNRIISDFGIDNSVLNFSEFANMSSNEQKKYIFGLYPPNKAEWNEEKIYDYLSELFNTIDLANDEFMNNILVEVSKKCADESVNAALEYVTSKFNEYNAQKKKDEIGMQELTAIKQSNLESVKGLAVAEKKQTEYSNTLAILTGDYEKGVANNKEVETIGLNAQKLAEEIDLITAELNLKSKDDLYLSLQQLSAKIKVLDVGKYESEQMELRSKLEILEIRLDTATKELEESEQEFEVAKAVLSSQDEKLSISRNNVSTSQNIVNSLQSTINMLSKFDGKCPVNCKVKCNTDMKPALFDLSEELDRNNLLFEELEQESIKDKQTHDELRTSLDLIESKIVKLKAVKTNAEVEVKAVNEKLDDSIVAFKQEENDIALKNAQINNTIDGVNHKIETIDNDIARLKGEIVNKQTELKTLEGSTLKLIDLTLITIDIEATRQHLAEINDQVKAKVKAKSDLENLAKKELDSHENFKNFEAYKLMKDAIGQKGLAGKMIIDAITPMILGVQENLEALIDGAKFYVDTDNFNFGWEREGHKRSYETLSNGETLILTTAIVIEFMQKTCKTKLLLIDNINDVDIYSAQRIVKGITALAHKYDTCIMAANFVDTETLVALRYNDNLNVIQL